METTPLAEGGMSADMGSSESAEAQIYGGKDSAIREGAENILASRSVQAYKLECWVSLKVILRFWGYLG